jgi:sterol desaturase/sphingolipid hydroxylase (fatty acid hydroxylase superfamily)
VSLPLLTFVIAALAFVLMLVLESLLPLRRTVEPKGRRVVRNLAVAASAAIVAELLRVPLLIPVVAWTDARKIGLLHLIEMPASIRIVLAFLFLDYTLWWWHWLSHRVPVLWRFHLVHHVDRDLDASTALRFHFGEHTLSVFFRIAQVVLIGAPPAALVIWQAVLFVSIFFHHSNLRLPVRLEALLVRLIVTPRMHGIHHSDHREEANSNWSSILSAWDWLHGTMLLGVPQREVVIGVPAYQDPQEVTIARLLSLPFRRQGDQWGGRIGPRTPRGRILAD